jgi:peroxiredoxin
MNRLLSLACLALVAAPVLADMPREGEPVPNVEAPVANAGKVAPGKNDGDPLSLNDFKGKKNVVLFFFPKAMTRG